MDVIAVQEIWDIRYPESVIIPGFKPLTFKKRRNMIGGGVGLFYFIWDNLIGDIIEELSPFVGSSSSSKFIVVKL
jgi:hypothetical protein